MIAGRRRRAGAWLPQKELYLMWLLAALHDEDAEDAEGN